MRLWHWFLFRVLTRCFVCQRPMLVHSHRQVQRCINTPLPIKFPWQVVPVSPA